MKSKKPLKKSLSAGLTAFCLFCGLLLPATAAAADITPTLGLNVQQSGNDYTLTLDKGNNNNDHVYGIQLEVTLDKNCPDAQFTPDRNQSAYATYKSQANTSGNQTVMTLYISSIGWDPIDGTNNTSRVSLGTLKPGTSAQLGNTASVTLLDRDLKEYSYANNTRINVSSNTAPVNPSDPSTPGNTGNTGSSSSGTSGTSSPSLNPLPDRNQGVTTPANPTTPEDPGTTTSSPFTDIDDSWAKDAINWANNNGYMRGMSATTFNPDGNISRQQMWMILARLSGANPANMIEAKNWAVTNNVSDGSNADRNMTRQQMVTFLYRYGQLKAYQLTGSTALTSFPDGATVSSYAQGPLSWAVANGIVTGTSQGTLNPEGTATRAQFAVILQRFYNSVVNK